MKKTLFFRILRLVLALALAAFTLQAYAGTFGSPFTMARARQRVQGFIYKEYSGTLEITGSTYSSKMGAYIVDVRKADDARVTGSMFYYPHSDEVMDDYQFSIQNALSDSATAMLTTLLSQMQGGDPALLKWVNAEPKIATREYDTRSVYSGREPLNVDIELDGAYTSVEAFGRAAYKLSQLLDTQPFPVADVVLSAFDARDGNTRYLLAYTGKHAFADESAALAACHVQADIKGSEYEKR